MNSGRGWHSHLFVHDLGLALYSGETCPHRPKALKTVNNGQVFPSEQTTVFFFFWWSRFQVPRGTPKNGSRKSSKNWLRRANIKSFSSPKIDPRLKLLVSKIQGNYATYTHFPHESPKRSRRFLEIKPDFLHTCSVRPCRPVNEGFFIFFFTFLVESLGTEKKTTNIWRKKNNTVRYTGWRVDRDS